MLCRRLVVLAVTFVPALLGACASPEGRTPTDQKRYALDVRDDALRELYAREPLAQSKLEGSPGYVFLSGFAAHPGLMTFANAYGIVQDNITGEQTHVRLTRFGLGPGLAIKGYYLVALLSSSEAVEAVREGTWNGGGLAAASLRFGDVGGSLAAEGLGGGAATESYIWTHTGFALELAAVAGKVYPEDELNR